MRMIESLLLPHQKQAIVAQEREVMMLGGIGTGKSYTIAQLILSRIGMCPKATILLCANSYQQLMSATVKALTLVLDDYCVPYESVLSGAKKRITIGKATILLYSLEKYDNIRGVEADFIFVDEACYAREESIQVLRGRLRGKNTTKHQIFYCSSPNGYNWAYEQFNKPILNNKRLIQCKTKDNIFLPPEYYNELLEQYGGETSPLARQELFGNFVNLQSGSIYCHFDRKTNVKPIQLNKQYPVYCGVDFNIDEMNATYIQYINGVFKLCHEVKLTHRNANTHDLGSRIISDLQGYNVLIVPDSTGIARKSSSTSSQSDIQILKSLGLNVMDTHNPLIRDRQQTLNVAFLKKTCEIDLGCHNTIKEIETLCGRDKEGLVSHLSVTLGYVLWKIAPLKIIYPQSQPRVIR